MSLKKGDKVPDFTLYDTERKERTLKEFLGNKTVLAFYPGAFTGVCTKEICQLRDSMATFNSLNAKVVGISIDSPFANKGFADLNKIGFPLLSDFNKTVSKQVSGLYDNFASLNGYAAAKRSVFVLDKDGVVRYAWVTENPATEPPYAEIEQALRSF
ncbi:MAG TPA: redoxin domain-containing protein [Bacteroidota bacterium]|nr:redoxin domain-containing protein [Bacteroidota bacterium]